jgi:lysyl-tRNA synthetase class I
LVIKTFLSDNFNDVPETLIDTIKTESFWKNLDSLEKVLLDTNKITLDNANDIVNQVKLQTGLNGKALYSPIRFVAIGQEHGPEMNKILTIVGKDKMLNNIKIIRSKFNA